MEQIGDELISLLNCRIYVIKLKKETSDVSFMFKLNISQIHIVCDTT